MKIKKKEETWLKEDRKIERKSVVNVVRSEVEGIERVEGHGSYGIALTLDLLLPASLGSHPSI